MRAFGFLTTGTDLRKAYTAPESSRLTWTEHQGLRHTALDADGLAAAEPALRKRQAGGIHWLGPWSVSDPGELVARYAAHSQRLGGTVVKGDASTLRAGAPSAPTASSRPNTR